MGRFSSAPWPLDWARSCCPYVSLGRFFGLTPVSAPVLAVLSAITAAYVVASEVTKRVFFRLPATRPSIGGPATRRSSICPPNTSS